VIAQKKSITTSFATIYAGLGARSCKSLSGGKSGTKAIHTTKYQQISRRLYVPVDQIGIEAGYHRL